MTKLYPFPHSPCPPHSPHPPWPEGNPTGPWWAFSPSPSAGPFSKHSLPGAVGNLPTALPWVLSSLQPPLHATPKANSEPHQPRVLKGLCTPHLCPDLILKEGSAHLNSSVASHWVRMQLELGPMLPTSLQFEFQVWLVPAASFWIPLYMPTSIHIQLLCP